MNKISIITATYNAGSLLEGLILSIIQQKYKNYEFVIIDGGSTDSTIEVIKKYENYVSFWVSEPDQGIYDAWNKGVAKSTGDWLMFLGADDMLLPDALDNYVQFLEKYPDSDSLLLLSSKREMIDTNGKSIRKTGYAWEWPLFRKFMTISHPGALHAQKLFRQYGSYNTAFKICGDYELLLRPREKLKAAFMDIVTVKMSEGGASDSISAVLEYYKASTTTGGNSLIKAGYSAILTISKFIFKKSLRKLGINVYLQK